MARINPAGLIGQAYTVELSFITEILGSQPTESVALEYLRKTSIDELSKELFRTHKSEGHTREWAEQEAARQVNESMGVSAEDAREARVQTTVFHRDDVGLHLLDYQVLGFLRESGRVQNLKVPGAREGTERSAKTAVERGIWVFPVKAEYRRRLYFMREGLPITEADDVYDRPKRVKLPTGQDATSLAASERLDPGKGPITLRFTLAVLNASGVTRSQVEALLAYGFYQGLGQWRGGCHGRFMADLEPVAVSKLELPSPEVFVELLREAA